jgi:hypothetical protein
MRRDALVREGGTTSLRGRGVLGDETLDGVVAETPALGVGGNRGVGIRRPLAEPCVEDLDGVVSPPDSGAATSATGRGMVEVASENCEAGVASVDDASVGVGGELRHRVEERPGAGVLLPRAPRVRQLRPGRRGAPRLRGPHGSEA